MYKEFNGSLVNVTPIRGKDLIRGAFLLLG